MPTTLLNADPIAPRDADHERALDEAGFRWGSRGTHTSRTLMLEELKALLAACPSGAKRDDYLRAIEIENCLGKRTVATRKLSGQRMSELYALDLGLPLFRALLVLWPREPQAQPLLALLLALARDPLLRATAHPVLQMQPGEELARQRLTDSVRGAVGNRLSDATLDKVVRNAASSWTQSGHLRGRGRKVRQTVTATTVAAAYALVIGHLAGIRGASLFGTLWTAALDCPAGTLERLAQEARKRGLLDMSQAGGVVDLSFVRLLAPDERSAGR